MSKSGWVSRQPPRSRPTTLRPASASSFARMVPVRPTPTVTTSTGFSLVAMRSPCGREHDTPPAPARGASGRGARLGELGRAQGNGRRDRVGDIVEVARIQGGDADAARLDAVYRVALAHRDHLLARQPRVREDAALLQNEAEVVRNALLQALDQLVPHRAHAVAHDENFLPPQEIGRAHV